MNQKQAMISAVLAWIGASLCCVAPLVLISLCLGGAWLANLTLFEPLRPWLIALSLAFIGFAYYQLYLAPKEKQCNLDTICANQTTQNKQRLFYWLVTIPLLGLLALPWIAPLFY